jgi:hypothetical protein
MNAAATPAPITATVRTIHHDPSNTWSERCGLPVGVSGHRSPKRSLRASSTARLEVAGPGAAVGHGVASLRAWRNAREIDGMSPSLPDLDH